MKQVTRSLNLPKPIAAYFSADKGDAKAVSECFTENTVVKDEGTPTKAGPQSKCGRRMPRQSINTRASLWRAKRRTERRSSPAIWSGTFLEALLTFDSFSNLKATRSRHWKSFREGRLRPGLSRKPRVNETN